MESDIVIGNVTIKTSTCNIYVDGYLYSELSFSESQVLKHLYMNMERIVPRETLLNAGWPDVYVNDNSLTQAIYKIRRILEQLKTNVQIKSFNRKGYLLYIPISKV